LTETVFKDDGEKIERAAKTTPDGRAIWQPHILQRGILLRELNWRWAPHEIDDFDVELARTVEALTVFDAFRTYARDLKGLSAGQSNVIKIVEEMRDRWKEING
jgi:hypothetical protein